jgi:hypothetical protein
MILPRIPVDGCLLIDLGGSNDTNVSYPDVDMLVKDIKIEFIHYINQSVRINGQYHNTEIDNLIKNNLQKDIKVDDSPRNTIAGTLFTSALTTFGVSIGSIHFTRTERWHRAALDESLRLGEITTLEREEMQATPRTIIEGTIDYTDLAISPLNVALLNVLTDLNFIFGVTEFNFMMSTFRATIWEIHTTDEVLSETDYTFHYLYQQT